MIAAAPEGEDGRSLADLRPRLPAPLPVRHGQAAPVPLLPYLRCGYLKATLEELAPVVGIDPGLTKTVAGFNARPGR